MRVLIEELYTSEECESIKDIYKNDPSARAAIMNAIGNKLIVSTDKIVGGKPLDAICLICLTSKFASSEDECYRVAITMYQHIDKVQNILPSIAFDRGLDLANKTLLALSFRAQALESKWKRYGAPSPAYYRKASKAAYTSYGQPDIAAHHEQWEGFLGEVFI
jgi:hypothetical protein